MNKNVLKTPNSLLTKYRIPISRGFILIVSTEASYAASKILIRLERGWATSPLMRKT